MLNLSSQLDRDLGLGSLERVELLTRLEAAFGTRLPDRVASERVAIPNPAAVEKRAATPYNWRDDGNHQDSGPG